MAEALLYVDRIGNRPPESFRQGDSVCCFTDIDVKCCHAVAICDVRVQPFNTDGLNPVDSLPWQLQVRTYRYRFDRVSRDEVMKTDLLGIDAPVLCSKSSTDPATYIDVDLYLRRRRRHPLHRIFGTDGAEVWFGGRQDLADDTKLTAVWQEIEARTALREVNHRRWPLTSREKRSFLALPLEASFDVPRRETAVEREEELVPVSTVDPTHPDPTRLVVKVKQMRRRYIDWQVVVAGPLHTAILDVNTEVDLRHQIAPLDERTLLIVR